MDPPIHVYVAILVRKRIILIMVYLHVSASYTNLKVIDSSSQNLLNHAFASHSILEFVAHCCSCTNLHETEQYEPVNFMDKTLLAFQFCNNKTHRLPSKPTCISYVCMKCVFSPHQMKGIPLQVITYYSRKHLSCMLASFICLYLPEQDAMCQAVTL